MEKKIYISPITFLQENITYLNFQNFLKTKFISLICYDILTMGHLFSAVILHRNLRMAIVDKTKNVYSSRSCLDNCQQQILRKEFKNSKQSRICLKNILPIFISL